jgi:transposase
VRQLISYKAEAEGIAAELVDEHYTSQTCPNCGKRHTPRGRNYSCGRCGFSAHRDVVGQINILSRYKSGQVGSLRAPAEIKHRMPHNLRLMRRRLDTGQPGKAKSRKLRSENDWFQLSALSSQFSPAVARGTGGQPGCPLGQAAAL